VRLFEKTFESLLAQLGPLNEVPEKGPMPMKLEAWPVADGIATLEKRTDTSGRTCRRFKAPDIT